MTSAGNIAVEEKKAVKVGIVMGSTSDWDTMKHASDILKEFGVEHECRAISAHRTPDLALEYAKKAEERGIQVIIAAAGGAAHLAGVMAAKTLLPVLGVPVQSQALSGLDSLLSMVQMPKGIPVGTLAIGKAGAANAALLAVAMMARNDPGLRESLARWRQAQTERVAAGSIIDINE